MNANSRHYSTCVDIAVSAIDGRGIAASIDKLVGMWRQIIENRRELKSHFREVKAFVINTHKPLSSIKERGGSIDRE